MLSVKSITGAVLQVETTDLSGQQLMLRDGPYKGKLVEVIGITGNIIDLLAIRLDGRVMVVNPDWVDGNGKGADIDLPEVL